MEISELIPHIEALIFASEKPLTSLEITDLINQAFGFMEDKVSADSVDAALEGIVEKYNSEFYPFEVRQSGGGWQFLTKKEFHKTVAQLNGEKFLKRLSAAALETLAIVAYKQPVTKGEIEAIRGVSSDYAVQKLLEKELIIISGRNEKLPGHPLVYATSKSFMDYFGINTAEDLPKIKEVLAEQVVEPTLVNHINLQENGALAVSDAGELVEADTEDNAEPEAPLNESPSFSDLEPPADGTLEDEAAIEEFVSDESFVAADEEEAEEQVEEEMGSEEIPGEDEPGGEDTGDTAPGETPAEGADEPTAPEE